MSKKLSNKTMEQLVFENNLFKKVMDELFQGIYITDENEKIIWMNKEIERSDAKVRQRVIGKTEAEIYGEIGRFHKYTTQTGQAVPMQRTHYYLPDGKRRDVLMTTKPYFEDGELKAVLTTGFDLETFQSLIHATLAHDSSQNIKKNPNHNRTTYTFNQIIGKSEALKSTLKMAKKAALSHSNILINGETGTGKELFAQSIHNASPRAKGQFIAINCAAIPETLLEGLLFGTSKGAFTGAVESPGLFELANGGSLFLDEINSMPLSLQAKLLRVLQEREVQRLGEQRLRPIDCRVISATNVDPLTAVRNKILREDIYFRLASITIALPPLRSRVEDISVLSNYLLEKKLNTYGQKKLAASTLEVLKSYSWPGNVRELEHALEQALLMMENSEITIEIKHLPPHILTALSAPPGLPWPGLNTSRITSPTKTTLSQVLDEFEATLLSEALGRHNGHLTKTAKELGISRQTLTNRLKRLNIKPV